MNLLTRTASAILIWIALSAMTGCAATPTMESTGEFVDDAAITAKVKGAIWDQPTLKMFEIHVETFKGTVRLSGIAGSPSTIDKAGEVARGVSGVKSVQNDMRLM